MVAANPDAPTLVIVGDGGFLMAGHELVTAQQNGLHFATLLVNDRCYGVLKNYQMNSTGRTGRRRARLARLRQAGRRLRRRLPAHRVGRRSSPDALDWALAELPSRCAVIELAAELKAPGQSV